MGENAYVHVANLITVFQNFAYEILKVAISLKPLSWTASINMIENIQKQLIKLGGGQWAGGQQWRLHHGAQLSVWGKSQLVAAVFFLPKKGKR